MDAGRGDDGLEFEGSKDEKQSKMDRFMKSFQTSVRVCFFKSVRSLFWMLISPQFWVRKP